METESVRSRFSQRNEEDIDEGDSQSEFGNDTKQSFKKKSPYTLSNICWFIASLLTFHITDFGRKVLFDTRVDRVWLLMGVILLLINMSIAAFCIIYLSYVKKITSDHWEFYYPGAIPCATACFALGSFCLLMALWSVWHIMTPFILFTFLMGIVVVVTWLPAF